MNNPYTSQGPLQDASMFFGRRNELIEISAFLRNSQSVSVVGPYQIGKTSLMVHLMRQETKAAYGISCEHLFAYINCNALSGSNQNEVLTCLCQVLASALNDSCLAPEPALLDVISNTTWFGFEIALRKINSSGVRVVFILDEFEQLTMDPQLDLNFYNALRSIASRLKVSFLICSSTPLIELTDYKQSTSVLSSPFFNIFAQMYLGLLSKADAGELIRKPMEASGIVVDSQLEQFIYSLVGGHPFALQVACSHAWNFPDDLNKIEALTKQDLEPIFHNCWQELSQDERDVLHRSLGAGSHEAGNPTFRIILRNLVRKCLLVQTDGSYEYPSRAWQEFVSIQSPA